MKVLKQVQQAAGVTDAAGLSSHPSNTYEVGLYFIIKIQKKKHTHTTTEIVKP